MARHRTRRYPVRTALGVLLAGAAVVTATVLLSGRPGGPGDDPVVLPAARTAPVVAPVQLSIPSIGVTTALTRLGVDATGALVPPEDFSVAGWFAAGPAPGEVGPAVLAGHVDSRRGPAVFYRLADVPVGGRVLVAREDGTTARFTVTRVAEYPKDAFPTAEVYGPTPDPQLRLITCGGDFDRARRSYTDNVVVYAHLTG
ncbi:class F sortase [Geodermatophilus sp. TF02-6]|uniref:class F sortase n=1 Tax=Geodermatophilus sp. TF02-6 TaxID=2250575 RepID=UPI000DE974A4|nr:class F sortase [Geodermatophilus sp. TF02-6]RBY79773.1 class F sortase [Geodermatophilus sp. TF02-6]